VVESVPSADAVGLGWSGAGLVSATLPGFVWDGALTGSDGTVASAGWLSVELLGGSMLDATGPLCVGPLPLGASAVDAVPSADPSVVDRPGADPVAVSAPDEFETAALRDGGDFAPPLRDGGDFATPVRDSVDAGSRFAAAGAGAA